MENVLIGAHTRLRAVRPATPLIGPLLELGLALLRPASVKAEEERLREEVRGILARFGERLLPRIDQPAYSLSYANRRRVEIARALALKPRLLLLDEPTAGMNPTETTEMQGLVAELKAEGLTILLIEHKLDMVMRLSDRVIVMDEGKKIAEGPGEDVRNDRQGDRGLSRSRPVAVGRRYAGDGGMTRRAPSSEPLLRLSNVNTFYGQAQVHFDLSIDVPRGHIVCLLGGNASGKSTTMKIILGLVKPRSGDLIFDGTSMIGLTTPQIVRRGIASVPEARRLFADMSVRENILMGAFVRNDSAEIARDLERVLALFPKLGQRLSQRAGSLSGGEQQMVAMARALMSRPRMIVMDEPTMGLSPLYVDRVLELIRTINKEGVSIFMVEQNASLALEIAHEAYVLQTGRIVLSGPARALKDDPRVRDAYLGGAEAV